jgi:alpha-glucoside transport system substrate-binding protein
MSARMTRSGATVLLSGLVVAAGLTACGQPSTIGAAPDCSRYAPYGNGFHGAKVIISSAIHGVEAKRFVDVLQPFERCTGITIVWQGSSDFEQRLKAAAKARSGLPDLAAVAQPGLLRTLVGQGLVHEAPEDLRTAAQHDYPPTWLAYGTVDGKFYAPPLGANVKSLVWYSPQLFFAHQWQIPTTLPELLALSRRIKSDAKISPWCAGIQAGAATGWPLTDWVEDMVLREQPPGYGPGEVYDKWVDHAIKFNDPLIEHAVDQVGSILRNPDWVNGGFGGVRSIVRTTWQDAGLPIIDSGDCALYKMASFYGNVWPEGTSIGPDFSDDIYAFPFPSADGKSQPLVVAGEFLAAFDDREETQAVQAFMSSPDFVNAKAKLGDWVSPNTKLDLGNVRNKVDQLTVRLLNTPNALIRFDASDMMPAQVGTGTFWTEMTTWLDRPNTPTPVVCDTIEASWPK